MHVSLTGEVVCVEVGDDASYAPDVMADLCARALEMYQALNVAPIAGDDGG